MSLPEPQPGLVIGFSYLWHREHLSGREEGVKDRPCAIVLVRRQENDETVVTVAPLTHSIPRDPATGVEVPMAVKRHLGLDAERSWIMCDEVNEFAWPGYDLRAIPGRKGRYDYGLLPPRLFEQVVRRIVALKQAKRGTTTPRA